jgi:hypothetical protein
MRKIFENTIYAWLEGIKDIIFAILAGIIPKLPSAIRTPLEFLGITKFLDKSFDKYKSAEDKIKKEQEYLDYARKIEQNRPASPTKIDKVTFDEKPKLKAAKIYDPVTKTFKEVAAKPQSMMKPVFIDPPTKESKSKNVIVKKPLNSENVAAYSDQELSPEKTQGEKKGSQTSRNEPTSRMVEEINQPSHKGFTNSTDTSSKLKQN